MPYTVAMDKLTDGDAVKYTTLCRIRRLLLHHILPTRPMIDLYTVCYQNAGLIVRSTNLSEEEKSKVSSIQECLRPHTLHQHALLIPSHTTQALREYEDHLYRATVEQSEYRSLWKDSRRMPVSYTHLTLPTKRIV